MSAQATVQQGVPEEVIEALAAKTCRPGNFDTAGDTQPADQTITNVIDTISDESAAYRMKACPWVFSQGKCIEQQQMPYIDLPGELPSM